MKKTVHCTWCFSSFTMVEKQTLPNKCPSCLKIGTIMTDDAGWMCEHCGVPNSNKHMSCQGCGVQQFTRRTENGKKPAR